MAPPLGKPQRDSLSAEEELRLSEERFRLLIEAVADYAIYMLDPSGNISTWNSGAEKIKGYAATEIVGKSFALFFTDEDLRAAKPEAALNAARTHGRFQDEGLRVRKDGSTFWASAVITPVRDAQGTLLGFAKVTRDLTDRLQAEETARALIREQAERSAALASEDLLRESEERYRLLSERLRVILEGVGEGITVQEREGGIIFANPAAARTSGFNSVEEFLSATREEILARFELRDEHGVKLDPEELPGRRVLRGEPTSTLVMQVRDRALGQEWWRRVQATAVRGADGKPELAISVWHDVTEDVRRAKHEQYLAQASAALSASLDFGSVLSNLAQLLVEGFADWCSIQLLEGNELQSIAVAHGDPDKVRLARDVARKYPSHREQPRGVWNVLRTGSSELHREISDSLLVQAAHDPEHLQTLRALGLKSMIIVPIRSQQRVLGAISLILAESGRRYDEHDLALAEELGRRSGSSIENAKLYAAERRAREQVALLASAGKWFSAASNYEQTLRGVVEIALPALGDFAFFDIVEAQGVRRIAAAYQDPEVDALIKATQWARSERQDKNFCALSSGESGFHPNTDDAWLQDLAGSPEHLALLRALHLGSLLTVPLRAQGEVLGSLTLCYGKSGRKHTQDDLKLAEELARRAAIAVVHVRLYEQAQEALRKAEEAAQRAEQANRVKDEFLATVSHELRTPLHAIVGWSALLREREHEPSISRAVEIIHRNALAQGKIIEDILDVSRIITGKLRLDLKPVNVVDIVQEAIEVVRPSANARGLTIALTPPGPECLIVADPERLQQVVWNLLSNAVKFSDAGGCIQVLIRHDGSKVVVSVSDVGRGVDPEFLPFVFERFKQADGSSTRRVGGLGLGLAIVRHLVELHGGQVQATSAGLGMGATFTVSLPVRAIAPVSEPPPPTAEASPEEELSSRPTAALAGLRVLVVDDEEDARDLLETLLTSAGATVETAGSAADALTTLRRFRPQVLVSDIGMPDEDGYSLMRRVAALEPEAGGRIPAIALTAYTRGQDKTRALAAGFAKHMSKPVDPDELVASIASVASGPDKSAVNGSRSTGC